MKIGKLDNETLERLVLGRIGTARDEVLVGPGIGEDCAVLDFGEYECVLSTDPITAGVSRIGTLAVHISCNDVASNGIEPLAIMLTVLLPPETTEDEVAEIARQADEAAKELGIQIIGGHTEVTDAVTQPLISAVAIGRRHKVAVQTKGDVPYVLKDTTRHKVRPLLSEPSLAPGDLLVVTKKLALEGTALAAEKKEKELRPYLTEAEIGRAKAMLDSISVVKEGVIAGRSGVKAMHDVTEGGVLGAVWEMCARTGAGAEIDAEALPFDEVTMMICAVLGLDPMRLISSGSMLICLSQGQWETLEKLLTENGIEASVIGKVTDKADGLELIMKNGEREKIGPPGPDEIYTI